LILRQIASVTASILSDTQSAVFNSALTSSRHISELFEITPIGMFSGFNPEIAFPRFASRVGSPSGTKVR
jgi:hypothetical protein